MTKGGIQILAKNLVVELSPYGITCNAVAPGATATEFSHVAETRPQSGAMLVGPVVKAALDALGHKSVVVAGFRNKLLVFFTRLIARRFATLAAARVMKSMGRGA